MQRGAPVVAPVFLLCTAPHTPLRSVPASPQEVERPDFLPDFLSVTKQAAQRSAGNPVVVPVQLLLSVLLLRAGVNSTRRRCDR